MSNIIQLAKFEIKRIFSRVISVVIIVGLIAMPSFFAWYNTLACWNVFDNTGQLPVAVASVDEGYESDLVPMKVTLGEQVISALRQNDQIDWVFTGKDDAIYGAKSGKYYAAVVIPEDFSRDLMTFYTDDVEHAKIVYYTNEKISAVAPKITDAGADTVSYQVNKVFAEEISKVALTIAKSLSNMNDKYDVTGKISNMSSNLRKVADDMRNSSDLFRLYSKLATSSSSLITDSLDLIDNVKGSISSTLEQNLRDLAGSEGGISAIEQSIGGLKIALSATIDSIDEMNKVASNSFTTIMDESKNLADSLDEQAAILNSQASNLRSVEKTLEDIKDTLPSQYQPQIEIMIAQIDSMATALDSQAEVLNASATNLRNNITTAEKEAADLEASTSATKTQLETIKEQFDNQLSQSMEQLKASASELSSSMNSSIYYIEGVTKDLGSTARGAATLLDNVSLKIDESYSTIEGSADKLTELSDKIDEAIALGDNEMLKGILGASSDEYATNLSAPVGVERTSMYSSDNFGSSMSPLYSVLALFIGALLIMVVFKPKPANSFVKKLNNPKPRHLFFGHLIPLTCVSFAQTTLMALGNLFFLGVQCWSIPLYLLTYWLGGFVFLFIIYALVVSFANVGKAIAVLLLIVQVTGCGGSFPLVILPEFVQNMSYWLPATHVVNMMRCSMFGCSFNEFIMPFIGLLVFLIPFGLLGLLLRKPVIKMMDWFLEKVEDSNMMS